MDNLTLGILTVFICTIGYFFAWLMFRKGNYVHTLLLILLCGLTLRIYMSSDHYLHEWDERFHAVVAKNLLKHPLKPTLYENTTINYDYKMWTVSNIWLEKPPVPLWFIATSLYIFGNSEFAVRIPSLILSVLAIYLTFLLGYYLFNIKIGLLAAFLHSINGIVIELAGGKLSSDHIETCFIVMIEIAVLFCVLSIIKKNKYCFLFLGGIFMGLAILSKWLPALIVLPVWITGAFFTRKYTLREIFTHLIVILLGCLIVALPWFIYIFNQFPNEANWVIHKFLFAYSSSIEGHNAPFWYYLNYVEIIFGEIVYIPLIFAIYFIFKEKNDWDLKLLSVWWIVPVIIFSFAETKRHTYLMISAPALFIITSWYWFYLKNVVMAKKYNWVKYLILTLLIILPVRLTIERLQPFNIKEMNPQWAKELRSLSRQIKEKKVVIFNSQKPIETMFYTNFAAYSCIPDSSMLNRFFSEGYTVYIYSNGILNKPIMVKRK